MVNRSSTKRRHESVSSSEDESAAEYQVEAILDKRIRGKKTEYFLKWKGYSNEDNTWEDENHLNCPDLVKKFESSIKKKKHERKSCSNNESKLENNKVSKKRKNTSMQNCNEDHQNDNYQSAPTEISIDSNMNEDDGADRIVTRNSKRNKTSLSTSGRRHSNRKVVQQAKLRITSMSNNQSLTEDDINEVESSTNESVKKTCQIQNTIDDHLITTIDDDDINVNNNSIEFPEQNSINEDNINESTTTTTSIVLRITPNSTSSISITRNDTDNSDMNEKISAGNHSNSQDVSEIIDETDQVEKVEAVRNNQDGISFRVKLVNENQTQWISSKIANLKYPQAIISFWESHVEFT
ncbi:unnamed protein product [Rotaria socialis]|uniref:Chromo domain-containing protein n=1 Tax=Rotaria socialis TaxID=392032 RepID=A0A820SXK5_9BILA|nr:unnamed protein product [Rotaria socialis]CAF3788753.1 unnamed protein product [Rotaria socialis]CAF4461672.1 unnamed protein product [Rotaria socialis]CAF4473930.1 unnamed protein product [Rotaria socialis]